VGAEDPEDLHPTGDTDQCGLRVIGGGLPSMLRMLIDPISDGKARPTIGRVELPPASHYDAHLKLA
jgi:hypothetical protein